MSSSIRIKDGVIYTAIDTIEFLTKRYANAHTASTQSWRRSRNSNRKPPLEAPSEQ